jgi:nuclear pore complex protein Nup62
MHMYVYLYMCIYIYVCKFIYVYIYIYIYMCIFMYLCIIYICVRFSHIYVYIYIYINIHLCTHICLYTHYKILIQLIHLSRVLKRSLTVRVIEKILLCSRTYSPSHNCLPPTYRYLYKVQSRVYVCLHM